MRPSRGLLLCVACLLSVAARLGAVEAGFRDLVFTPVPPCRVLDTRPGMGGPGAPGPLTPGALYSFAVTGLCGVPAEARAAMLNFVAVSPPGAGHLLVWPYDSANPTPPNASLINFVPGQALANGVVVPLCEETTATENPGDNCDASLYAMTAVSPVHLVVDVLGYFAPPGYGRLWGDGRLGAVVYGTEINEREVPCTVGGLHVWLSALRVESADVTTACPAGTWVCTFEDVSGMVCNTTRPDSDCDSLDCDGQCSDSAENGHLGWLATIGGWRSENSSNGFMSQPCGERAVWCCSH